MKAYEAEVAMRVAAEAFGVAKGKGVILVVGRGFAKIGRDLVMSTFLQDTSPAKLATPRRLHDGSVLGDGVLVSAVRKIVFIPDAKLATVLADASRRRKL